MQKKKINLKLLSVLIIAVFAITVTAVAINESDEVDAFVHPVTNDTGKTGTSYSKDIVFSNGLSPRPFGTPYIQSPSWMSISSVNNLTGHSSDGNATIKVTGTPTTAGTYTCIVIVPAGSGGGSDLELTWTCTVTATAVTYSVSYNSNGGSGSIASHSTSSYVSLKANTFTAPAQMKFVGWKANNTGAMLGAGTHYYPTANVTMYAQWEQSYFVLSFHPNGGTGTMSSINFNVGSNGTASVSSSQVPTSTFTPPSGKEFLGWSFNQDGSNVFTPGSAGLSLTSNRTLYAVWKDNGGPTHYTQTAPDDVGVTGQAYSKTITYANNLNPSQAGTPMISAPPWMTISNRSNVTGGSGTSSITVSGTPPSTGTFSAVIIVPQTGNGGVDLHITWTCTVTAQAISYTVSYDGNGGSGSVSPQTTTNSVILNDNGFSLQYSKFVGWKANNTGTTLQPGSEYIPTTNVTMYAQWERTHYVITYHSNNIYDETAEILAAVGSNGRATVEYLACTFTAEPNKTFYYWASGSDGSTPITGPIASTRDMDIYAMWKDGVSGGPFNIRFDANGGEGLISEQQVMGGVSIVLPMEGMNYTGFYLAGWRATSNVGTLYDLGAEYTVERDVTLYAEWKTYPLPIDPNAPTVGKVGQEYVYKPDMHNTSTAWCIYLETLYTGSQYSVSYSGPSWLNIITSPHKVEFAGTPTSPGAYLVEVSLTGPSSSIVNFSKVCWVITVYPDGTMATTYSLVFSNEGGSGFIQPYADILPNNAVILPGQQFTKEGYTQVGWLDKVNGTDVVYFLGSIYTVEKNTTLRAYWVANPNIVIFNANGGSGSVEPYIAYTDGQITLPSDGFTRPGFTLEGWFLSSDSNTIYAKNYIFTIEGTVTFYAYWVPSSASTYNITYNSNGGTGSLTQKIEPGKNVVLPVVGFNKADSLLAGWSDSATGTNDYAKGQVFTPTGSKILYAYWVDATSGFYTVSFSLNGGSGSVTPQQVISGSFATEPPANFSKAASIFIGWKEVGGATWNWNTPITSDITLEAQWERHFSIVTNGTSITLTVNGPYAGLTTINWGPETATITGNQATYDYGESIAGTIRVTSDVGGQIYTSSIPFAVSSPNDPNPQPTPDPDPNPEDKDEFPWMLILLIVGSIIFIIVVVKIAKGRKKKGHTKEKKPKKKKKKKK